MNKDVAAAIGVLASIALIPAFMGYLCGRALERRAITVTFVAMTEQTYHDGYSDGFKACGGS